MVRRLDRYAAPGALDPRMIRLAVLAVSAVAAFHAPPVVELRTDLRDFRERQLATGRQIGCELQMAIAAVDHDRRRHAELSERCLVLKDRRAAL